MERLLKPARRIEVAIAFVVLAVFVAWRASVSESRALQADAVVRQEMLLFVETELLPAIHQLNKNLEQHNRQFQFQEQNIQVFPMEDILEDRRIRDILIHRKAIAEKE